MGLKRDMTGRVMNIRIDSPAVHRLIEAARVLIFEKGLGVRATRIKNLLDPKSLLPMRVCFFSCFLFFLTDLFYRVPFLFVSQNSVSITMLSSPLISCMSLSWESGKPSLFTSCAYWLPWAEILFRNSTPGVSRFYKFWLGIDSWKCLVLEDFERSRHLAAISFAAFMSMSRPRGASQQEITKISCR